MDTLRANSIFWLIEQSYFDVFALFQLLISTEPKGQSPAAIGGARDRES